MEHSLEALSKSEDKEISRLALKLIELGCSKHGYYEVTLRHVIK